MRLKWSQFFLDLTTNFWHSSTIMTLLKKSCDPHLFNEAFQCKRDVETWIVTRPKDEAIQRREAENVKDEWYTNILSVLTLWSIRFPLGATQKHKPGTIWTQRNQLLRFISGKRINHNKQHFGQREKATPRTTMKTRTLHPQPHGPSPW